MGKFKTYYRRVRTVRQYKIVVQKNMGRTSLKFMSSDQDRIEVKTIIVLIRCSRKAITGRFRSQGEIKFRVEVNAIVSRGAYRRSRFEGGTDLIPQD